MELAILQGVRSDFRIMKIETFKVLEQAAVPATQAYAIAQAIEIECAASHDSLATKVDLANLQVATKVDLANLQAATKSDLVNLQAATKVDLANLQAATQADLANLQAATKSDLVNLQAATKVDLANFQASTRLDLANLRADLVRWLFLVILGQTAVLAAAGYFYVGQLLL
jgi:hypothetical protein